MNSSFLKFGDKICLYSDEGKGFLQIIGFNYPNFIVQKIADKCLALVPNQRNMVYEIVPKLNYNLQQEFNKISTARNKLQQQGSLDLEQIKIFNKKLAILSERRQNEIKQNELTINNSRGNPMIYGMTIQLMHSPSGQFLHLSKKSAEKDKTCNKLEITFTPSQSRVSFQIQPRYKYRQEGDRVIYGDQILLYNVKNNSYIHFSKDLEEQASPAIELGSEFRPKSPQRRRNPENLFPWFESNVSQNFEKWTVMAYRQSEEVELEDFYLHGGDIIRLKHSETGGFITIDDVSKERNGQQEAYLRVYKGEDVTEMTTTNQLFEIEKTKNSMDKSGEGLEWQEDSVNLSMICPVNIRHFNSGRLIQVTFGKEQDKIVYKLTLQNSGSPYLDDDGNGVPELDQLNTGVLQNFEFNLFSRSIVGAGQNTLSKNTVCNIQNQGTKLYLSTQLVAAEREEDDSDDENANGDNDNQKNQDMEIAEPVGSSRSNAKNNDDFVDKKDTVKKEKIFRAVKDDQNSDYIQKNTIILKPEASMNDVFIPLKATHSEISDVQFCQSTVHRLKQYLLNIRQKNTDNLNLPFYISIQELLKEIIDFVLDLDKTLYVDHWECDGYPNNQRQKIMRETRLIDLLIDCLAYPFITNFVEYDELSEKHPITRICSLIYRLLKHCVKDYTVNKNYVAQWIDLFFKQAMKTNETNSFGAEKTIAELLANNKRLLDTQIEPSTIIGLVDLCLTQPKHERFLNLLSGICSCNGDAIPANQENITDSMLVDQANRIRLFCPMVFERGNYYVLVKENLLEEEIQPISFKIDDFYAKQMASGDTRLYFYFQSLLSLCSSMCLDRNYGAIKLLEDYYTLNMTIDCTLNANLQNRIRAQFARLLIHLHMDKDPLEKLNVPIMTRVWGNVQENIVQIPQGSLIPAELLRLKPAFQSFITDRQGICKVYETDFNLFMIEALRIIETMICLGFYSSEQELIQIMDPLITLLDGSLDFYDDDEEIEHKKRLAEGGKLLQPVPRTKEQNAVRYKRTLENEIIMRIKLKIVQICSKVMDIQDNTRLTRFLICYSDLDSKGLLHHANYMQLFCKAQQSNNVKKFAKKMKEVQSTIDEINGGINTWIQTSTADRELDLQDISQKDFICILLDLNLYENPTLVSSAFKLLIRYFTQRQSLVDLGWDVQLLQDQEEIAVLEACTICLREMKNDVEKAEFWIGIPTEDGLKQSRNIIDRLSSLTDLCVFKENRVVDLGNKKEEPKKGKRKQTENEEQFEFLNLSELRDNWDDTDQCVWDDSQLSDQQNQRLLRNLKAHEVALTIIRTKTLKSAQNKNSYLNVLEKSYVFLIKFVKGNKDNQQLLLNEVDQFLEDVDLGVHALELICEVFRDNECLLTLKLTGLIKRMATCIDQLDIETTKKATLISFISVFMFYKDQTLQDNQYIVLCEFTSPLRRNSNFLFTGADGHENLRIYIAEMKQQYLEFTSDDKLMAEINVPPEISYIISYINMISQSGMGKNALCETRAQAVFPFKDTIINMRVADFCYPLKSALLYFLHFVYFEVEKELQEEFTMTVWQVIEIVVEDLQKFVEVQQRNKRSQGIQKQKNDQKKQDNTFIDLSDKESAMGESVYGQIDVLKDVQVDVFKNFDFVTAFGRNKISDLFVKYVYEDILPTIRAFLLLRLPMKENHRRLVKKLLKLIFISVGYKSKPIHDTNCQMIVRTIRTIPQLQDLGGDIDPSQLGLITEDNEEKNESKLVNLNIAQKFKIYLTTAKKDDTIAGNVVKEFENLVKQIINIKKNTEEKFQGTNTIEQADYIKSLIFSSDVGSDIPTNSRTQALKIVRKVIESECYTSTKSAFQWKNEDWMPFKEMIVNAQNMLNQMGLINLIARIITFENSRGIKEEAFLVGIAVLLGGNVGSQMQFAKYIVEDDDNLFIKALVEMLDESYEIIKRNQNKRNTKMAKIVAGDKLLQELEHITNPADEKFEDKKKLIETRQSLEEDIKDTEYKNDETRDAEELTFSRALENLKIMLRLVQLLCEGHNLTLQKILCSQIGADGKPKPKSSNVVQLLARYFEQFQKVANSVTMDLAHQMVDTIVETVQGPCKENQQALVNAKILDSSREFINAFGNKANLSHLGFMPPEDGGDDQEEILIMKLDQFISKISTMLMSLIEGEQDIDILQKIEFSLSIEDIKNRIVDVYGVFLQDINLYPVHRLQKGEQSAVTMLSILSKRNNFDVLQEISMNKVNKKMNSTVFLGAIQEAFQLYSIIKGLTDGLPRLQKILSRDGYTNDQWKVLEFLRQNTARFEVSVNGSLQRIYFPINPVCKFISLKTRKNLMEYIDRESQTTKVTGLMEAIPSLIDEMKHNEHLENATVKITPHLMNQLKDFSSVVGFCISMSQLFFLTRVNNFRDPASPEWVQKVVIIFGGIQGTSSGTLCAFYFINKFQLIIKEKWRQFVSENRKKFKIMPNDMRLTIEQMSIEATHLILMCCGPESDLFRLNGEKNFGNWFVKLEYHCYNLYFFFQDGVFRYYVLYFAISIMGFTTHELFYSFHLLDVIQRSPTLINVTRSITSNLETLILTFVLGVIIFYIFAQISFFYLQDTLYDWNNNAVDSSFIGEGKCGSAWDCFFVVFEYGLIYGGGIGDYTSHINWNTDTQLYLVKLCQDISFFLILKVIWLNILFGIIVDTFAMLREEKAFILDDRFNKCFICNFDRLTFDRNSEVGFDRHIDQDHNLWFYVYYVVHLNTKDSADYTGIESYVADLYEKGQITWIPRQKALCLQNMHESEQNEEVAGLRKEIAENAVQIDIVNERLVKVLQQNAEKKKKEK